MGLIRNAKLTGTNSTEGRRRRRRCLRDENRPEIEAIHSPEQGQTRKSPEKESFRITLGLFPRNTQRTVHSCPRHHPARSDSGGAEAEALAGFHVDCWLVVPNIHFSKKVLFQALRSLPCTSAKFYFILFVLIKGLFKRKLKNFGRIEIKLNLAQTEKNKIWEYI